MRSISTWLLGGALTASLTWNWTLQRAGAAPAARAECGTTESCALDLSCAALAPEEEQRLAAICARSCAASDELERRADLLQAELLGSLSGEEIDRAATTRLVGEVTELRRQSLEKCVEGILGVREVLSAEDVRALLERCTHAPGSSSCK
jgi:hypothetical protein